MSRRYGAQAVRMRVPADWDVDPEDESLAIRQRLRNIIKIAIIVGYRKGLFNGIRNPETKEEGSDASQEESLQKKCAEEAGFESPIRVLPNDGRGATANCE